MRHNLLLAASVAALMAVPAYAQETTEDTAAGAAGASAYVADRRAKRLLASLQTRLAEARTPPPGPSPEQLLEDAPVARAAYLLRDDLANLDAVLDDLLELDPLERVRGETKTYYLGDFADDVYAEGFLMAAREAIGERTSPA